MNGPRIDQYTRGTPEELANDRDRRQKVLGEQGVEVQPPGGRVPTVESSACASPQVNEVSMKREAVTARVKR